jgi:hypothetical protein
VAVRGFVVVFAAAVNWTVPFPVPAAPAVMLAHVASLVAVHAHEGADAVTVTEPDAPAATTDWLVGDNEKVHDGGGAAAWVTVTVCPATVSVPVRNAVPVFAVNAYVVLPVPVPLAPELMVSHDVAVDAVHAQVDADGVTVIELVPAPAPTGWLVADSAKVHGAAAACVIANAVPAMVSVAVRGLLVALSATVNWTVPLPMLVAPAVMLAHVAPLVALHAHEGADAVTVTVPDAPTATTDWLVDDNEKVHGGGGGGAPP